MGIDGGGRRRWYLLDAGKSEPCTSSILAIFDDYVQRQGGAPPVVQPVRPEWLDLAFADRERIEAVVTEALALQPNISANEFRKFIEARACAIQSIAAFLVANMTFAEEEDAATRIAELAANTFAYHLADATNRERLVAFVPPAGFWDTGLNPTPPVDGLKLSLSNWRGHEAVPLDQPGGVVGSRNASSAWRSSSIVSKVRTQSRFSLSVRMNRSAQPLPSGARTKAGELSMPRKASSFWKWSDMYCEPWSWRTPGRGRRRRRTRRSGAAHPGGSAPAPRSGSRAHAAWMPTHSAEQ